MKKNKKKGSVNPSYIYKEKNIYKTGNSYRVRVSDMTINVKTLKQAREIKEEWISLMNENG